MTFVIIFSNYQANYQILTGGAINRKLFLSLFLVLFGISSHAQAARPTPFATTNQNPLIAIYGLPAADSSEILPAQETEVQLRSDIANSCSISSANDEDIVLDGETYRTRLRLKRGIGHNLEVGIELPYISHTGGFLDGFIDNWHTSFGFPEGERNNLDRDQLNYSYTRSTTQIDLHRNEAGFGDISLTGGWQIKNTENTALALRTSLKVPTGDADKLTGSGGSDLAIWISGSQTTPKSDISGFAAIGGLWLGEGDVLAKQQNKIVAFGTLGASWQAYRQLALKVQCDGHTAFYHDSSLRELGESAQLIIGGTVDISSETSLDLAISEDIYVDSAPDVTFHLALTTRF